MKKPSYIALVLLSGLLCSCAKDLCNRPVTIDRVEFTNKAGEKYDEQFGRVNSWFLQKIKALETEKQTFRIDTVAKKRHHKYNHTLVASLEELEVDDRPGLYYQLYLRPNSGIGKIKGQVQHDIYNELKLYSPERSFLSHGQQFYSDSLVAGPFAKVMRVQELLEPLNVSEPDMPSFSIDSIRFPKSFKKRHREYITKLMNNSIVLMQERNAGSKLKQGMRFNYHPNFKAKEKKVSATYTLNLQVAEDPVANKITVHISSPGYTPERWQSTKASFNRRDFLKGHTYEANHSLRLLAPSFLSSLYYAKRLK
ncbi:hypothetical protein [Pontibacter litorisediminis]|uniref:hypothetical protein n=1 Tax=Pontibacter litorisediminis TaxID=1846260 RepID=UPI0023EB8FD3|nr:hypothetical protein [Pontibacter litorisediminis]